jgi:tetratricopeptide (TPR) repeat protein
MTRSFVQLVVFGAALLLSAGCASTSSREQAPVAHSGAPETPRNPALAKSFDDAVARGDAAWHAGEADMAVYFYIQALSFQPRDVVTLTKLGTIEQTQGNLTLAARAFELAANAKPSDANLTGRLGLILTALGDNENAYKWLKLSADNGSTDWRVVDQLSVVETREGRYSNAVQYAGQAAAQAPKAAKPLLHRAEAYYGMGEYAMAEYAVRDALHLGNSPDAWQLLGKIQAKQHAYPASIDSLLQVMDSATAYNTAGKLALDNGDNKVALGYFEKASAASPVYLTDVQRNAAIARERLGAVKQ